MKKNKNKSVKINVIPILDAVFIFIFFLLMSAQFVDVYEIETDVPKISEVKDNSKIKPLNLTLKIEKEQIIITTGLDNSKIDTIERFNGKYNLEKLNRTLMKIKSSNYKEQSIVLKPEKSVAYHEIVSIIDNVRKSHFGAIKNPNLNDGQDATTVLFDQIIFETII